MSEVQRLINIKAALITTTSTPGWEYIKQVAANVVEKATAEILNGKDAADREERALKAIALRDGFADIFNVIDAAKQFDTNEEPEWFSQLAWQEEQQ